MDEDRNTQKLKLGEMGPLFIWTEQNCAHFRQNYFAFNKATDKHVTRKRRRFVKSPECKRTASSLVELVFTQKGEWSRIEEKFEECLKHVLLHISLPCSDSHIMCQHGHNDCTCQRIFFFFVKHWCALVHFLDLNRWARGLAKNWVCVCLCLCLCVSVCLCINWWCTQDFVYSIVKQ